MKKAVFILGGIVLAAGGWYALSPLFMNKEVQDALPGTAGAPVPASSNALAPSQAKESPIEVSEPVPVVATPAHPASGVVRIVKTGEETVVRYENYKTINGPDVRVYLATDLEATDFVDLGPLKGTEGNINYPVPPGTPLEKYRYVLTWCEDFSVLFNSADLSAVREK